MGVSQSNLPHEPETLLIIRGESTMSQQIPEHPASYLAEAIVILMILISVLYMVKEWGG